MARVDFADFALVLSPSDNVAVLKRAVHEGDVLSDTSVELRVAKDIPSGHKVAIREIPENAPVRKYGQIIGFAGRAIAAGEHVHTHNLIVRD